MGWMVWLAIFMAFALCCPRGAVLTILGAWYFIVLGLIAVPAAIILVAALAEILQ